MTQVGETKPQTKPQRQSQVVEQTGRLEKNLSTLHTAIGNLTDRLSAVLRSSAPPSVVEKGKDSVELVVLASAFKGFGDSVKLATFKIEDIFERLEL